MREAKLDVARLAVSYRRLVLWFGVQLAIAIIGAVAMAAFGDSILGLVVALCRLLGLLVTIVALGYYAFRTAVSLGSSLGAVWAVAMLVPFVNAVTLLVLSSRATKACRAAGIPVGLLGPKHFQPAGEAAPDESAG